MNIIETRVKLCPCCMETHPVSLVQVEETNIFKEVSLVYIAKYEYCSVADDYFASDILIDENDCSMKAAYREKVGLLSPEEVKAIRESYRLSQRSFARVLGFGDKTITRYENGSIADAAQNNLIELVHDPKNFLLLLQKNRESVSPAEYSVAFEAASKLSVLPQIPSKFVRFSYQKQPQSHRRFPARMQGGAKCYA